MDISIIIVSWNVKDKLRTNLKSLFESSGDFKFEVFVVDNDSTDSSVDMVCAEFPAARLIANSENLGFAQANNQAIKLATGEFILLLNPDMRVQPDTLEKVLAWANNNPSATVSGCKLIDENGEVIRQVRRFPGFFDQLLITLKVPHLIPAAVNKYLCADFNYAAAAKVDSIRGAFFLINRENYRKISGSDRPFLDERYFIWFEEVDFCRQVYKLGGEVWYTPAAQCVDYVGASFRQIKRGQGQKYFSESMLKYFQKWGKKWEYWILKIVWGVIRVFIK
ncbi:MAG: glycosyltransferase family 2 protein [Patescibacteria group bacterium]